MRFLCMACDAAMRLASTAGPDEGSLTVTFACPACGYRVAMLTNPWETQLVRSLGVKVGGAVAEAPPFAEVRASLARQREGAFVDGERAGQPGAGAAAVEGGAATAGPGCPFAAMIPGDAASAASADGPTWTPEAAARIDRIPAFIRPMAKTAIERFARERGHATITDAVMDEARTFMGM
jgi:Proto-chlorophyllide reductase 57 kD subunit